MTAMLCAIRKWLRECALRARQQREWQQIVEKLDDQQRQGFAQAPTADPYHSSPQHHSTWEVPSDGPRSL